MLRLFLYGKDFAVFIKFDDAEAFRIIDVIAENGCTTLLRICNRLPQEPGQTIAIENIIAEHHGAQVVPDKFFADQESLRKTVRGRLHGVLQPDTELTAVTKQSFEARCVRRCGNDQNDVEIISRKAIRK